MGVGKSSVGRLVADALGLGFVDIDEEIKRTSGKDIPSIFEEDGEASFRDLERKVTTDVAAKKGVVIACGGGTVLDDGNLRSLSKTSRLILLTAENETILRRVEADGDSRPLLNVDERLARLEGLLDERMPRYLAAAETVVDTTGKSQDQVAEEIIEYLREGR